MKNRTFIFCVIIAVSGIFSSMTAFAQQRYKVYMISDNGKIGIGTIGKSVSYYEVGDVFVLTPEDQPVFSSPGQSFKIFNVNDPKKRYDVHEGAVVPGLTLQAFIGEQVACVKGVNPRGTAYISDSLYVNSSLQEIYMKVDEGNPVLLQRHAEFGPYIHTGSLPDGKKQFRITLYGGKNMQQIGEPFILKVLE